MLLSKFVHFTRERSSSSSSSLYAVGATRRRRGAASMASRGRVSTSRRTAPTACRWPGPSCRRARCRPAASRTGSRRRTSSRGRRGARRRHRSTCPWSSGRRSDASLALNEPVVQGEVVQQPVPTVAAAYAAPYHPGGVPPASFNAIPPPGGAPGGRWTTDKYMGPFSWGIGLCTCCCLCFMCCPCDERQVYQEPSGRKILQSGGPAGRFNEMC